MNNKKYWHWLIVLIILGLAVTAYLLSGGSFSGKSADDKLIGGDQDEHGCLIAAGYSWCETTKKCLRIWEEDCQDEIANILSDLRTKTNLNLSVADSAVFDWYLNDGSVKPSKAISGLAVKGEVLTNSQLKSVESYFIDNGFVADDMNKADGPMGSLIGYSTSDGQIVCQLTYQFNSYDPLSQTEKISANQPETVSAVISCGRLVNEIIRNYD